MMARRESPHRKLRILHVFRAPLGGLFRHVVDLAGEQVARGHEVGLYFDTLARGEHVERALAGIQGDLRLGVGGCLIHRHPHLGDALALHHFVGRVRELQPDVVHGHGSKGGAYARLPGLLRPSRGPVRAYTPHGGSFNYQPGELSHRLYMAAEKMLTISTDVFLFESEYIAARFDALVGAKNAFRRIVANGVSAAEFIPVPPNPDAADFLYVGELRAAKGIDTLLDALALVGKQLGTVPRAVLVGSGPDKALLLAHAKRLGVADRIEFVGPMVIREAFKLGRLMVVPSRAESLPYVVLEAAGARVPIIATDVGGIPQIFGPYANRLGPSDDPASLCARMIAMLDLSQAERDQQATQLAAYVEANFSIGSMVDAVMEGYAEAIARRAPHRAARLSDLPSKA